MINYEIKGKYENMGNVKSSSLASIYNTSASNLFFEILNLTKMTKAHKKLNQHFVYLQLKFSIDGSSQAKYSLTSNQILSKDIGHIIHQKSINYLSSNCPIKNISRWDDKRWKSAPPSDKDISSGHSPSLYNFGQKNTRGGFRSLGLEIMRLALQPTELHRFSADFTNPLLYTSSATNHQ